MKSIGIAGAIGVGKSSILRALAGDAALARDLGGAVVAFDADEVLRSARNQPGPLRDAILAVHPSARSADGGLDSTALAKAAFDDPLLLKRLEQLQWPVARAALHDARDAAVAGRASLLLVEAIALLESGLIDELDGVLVLTLPTNQRRARAVGRGLDAAAFDRRDAVQRGLTEALLAAGGIEVSASGSVHDVVTRAGRAIRLLCSANGSRRDPAT